MKTRRNISIVICLCINLIFPYSIFALPQKGSVVSGQIDLSSSASQMNIHQHSQKAIINWQSFSIDSGELVRFVQPNAQAAILNRVTGFHPTLINGVMQANGNVFLINPNGILVGQSGVIQTHGFIGATLNIKNDDFLNNSFQFEFQPGTSIGNIINRGLIKSRDAGFVSLLAPEIENHGTIMANMGKIHLAAGEKIKLSFVENNLISFAIDPNDIPTPTNTHIENTGNIQSSGGEILMSAKTAGDMVHSIVNNSGIIEATSLVNENGVVRLTGADEIHNTGKIDVSGETGGQIDVSANTIVITEASELNASGNSQGGIIRIGGGRHGQNDTLANAQNTYIGEHSNILANANESGDGGEVIVWGDQATIFTGNISAKGGQIDGQGGFVEVSGKEKLFFDGNVSTKAANGSNGTLLLDPKDIIIKDGDIGDLGLDFSGQVNFSDIPDELNISENRLESLSANTDIRLQANHRILIGDLTDNELTLKQTGNVSFITGSGGFSMSPEDTINISGGGSLLIDAFGSENDAYPATDGPVILGPIRTVGIGSVTIQGTTISLAGQINAGGTVTINNRDVLQINRAIESGGDFLQKGPSTAFLYNNITATGEISFTDDISLHNENIRLISRDGSILLMNSKIVQGIDGCTLTLQARNVVSLNNIDISGLSFANMSGGLILNGDIHIESAFDTTSVQGMISVDEISSIYTQGKPVSFNAALTLKERLTINIVEQSQIDNQPDDITFLNTIDGPYMLDLKTNTGNIYFHKDVGKNEMIDGLHIRAAQNVQMMGDILSDNVVDLNYAGLLTQGGILRTTADNILLHGDVQLTSNSVYDTSLEGGDLQIMGNLDGTRSLEENLDIITGNGSISINGAVGSVSIPGDIHISKAHSLTVEGSFQANSLLSSSGTGNVHFKDHVTTYEGGIHLHGRTLELNGILNSNKSPILLAADSFKLDNEIHAQDASITLYSHSAQTTIGVADTSQDINFSNNDFQNFKTSQIIIGHVENTGGITIAREETITQNKQLQFISSGPISIHGNIVTGNNAQIVVTNFDNLYVAPGIHLTLDGGWLQNGDGPVQIGGAITTTDDQIQFNGPVSLLNNLTLDTGHGLGDIHFAGKINGTYYLSANSGMGNIIFADQVGAGVPIHGLTLKSSSDIEIGSQFYAGSMTIINNGVLRLTSGADIQLDNAFSQQGVGPVELAGKISTQNENISFTQPVSLIDNAALDTNSGPGNILFQNTIDGYHLLTMNAGAGNIQLKETVGGNNLIAGLRIQSAMEVSFLKPIVSGEESLDITAKIIKLTAPVTTQNGGLLAFENSELLSISEDAILTLDGPFFQRSTGPVQLSTDIVTTGDEINIKGPLTLTKNIRFDTGSGTGGDILFSNNVTGDHFITLNSGLGNILFDQSLSVNGLFVESANTLTMNGDTQLGADGIDAHSTIVEINNNISTNNKGAVRFVTDGDFKLSSGVILNIDGAFTQTGEANVNLGGSIQTQNQPISFDGNITLIGQSILHSGDHAGDILFKGDIDGGKDEIHLLTINAGQGNISINGHSGRNDLFNLKILSAQNVSLNAPSRLNSFVQEDGTGITHFKDTLYLGPDGFDFTGKDISFENNVSCDSTPGIGMQIRQSGQLNIKLGAQITLTGSFVQTGEGTIALGGHIETDSATIEINSPIVLIDNATIQSKNSGNVLIQQTVDGSYQLDLSAGTGDLIMSAPIGGQSALLGLSVENASNIQLNVPIITKSNGIQLKGGEILASGNWFTNNGEIAIDGNIITQGDWQTAGGNISIRGNMQTNGNWITTGGNIDVDGNIQTAGDWNTGGGNISIDGNTTLNDHIVWQTHNGNIDVDGTIDGKDAFSQNMTINAGTGDLLFQQPLGAETPLKDMDIQSATNVNIESDVYADRFQQISTNGQTRTLGKIQTNASGIHIQNSALDLQGDLNSHGNNMVLVADQMSLPSVIQAKNASVTLMPLSIDASIGIENPDQTLVFTDAALDGIDTNHLIFGSEIFNGAIVVGKDNDSVLGQQKDLSLITNGNISIFGHISTEYQNNLKIDHGQILDVSANFILNGDFIEQGNGNVKWSGDLLGTGDITFNQDIILTGDSSWRTSDGNLIVSKTIDGLNNLNVMISNGTAIFLEALGKNSPLKSLNIVAKSLDINEIHTSMSGINIVADTIRLQGNMNTVQGQVLLDGDVHILSDLFIDTEGGNLQMNGQLTDQENSNKITIATSDGTISLQAIHMGAVVFNSGGNLVLNDHVNVGQEWNTTQLADIELKNDITIQTENTDIRMTNRINGYHSLTLDTGEKNEGKIHISGELGQGEALKSLSIENALACYIDGHIMTSNGDVFFKPSVMLTDDLFIHTGTGVGDVRFEDKVYSRNEQSHHLNIMSGGGDIYFMKDVGPNTPIGKISIEKARNVFVENSFIAQDIMITPSQSLQLGGSMTASNGNIIINGDMQSIQNQLQLKTLNGNISISGHISDPDNTHTLTLNANTGRIDINDVSLRELEFLAADQGLQLNGNIDVNDRFDTSNIAGPIILKNDTSIQTRNIGEITLKSSIDGPYKLVLNSNNGTIYINQPIGQNHVVQAVLIDSAENVILGNNIHTSTEPIRIQGDVTLLKDNILLDSVIGDIVITGKITDNTNDFKLNINADAGTIHLWELDIAAVQLTAPNKGLFLNDDIHLYNGFNTTEVAGPITIQSPLSIETASHDVILNTNVQLNGDLSINTGSEGGNIEINGTINGNHDISVSSGKADIALNNAIGNEENVAQVSVVSGKNVILKGPIYSSGSIHLDNSGVIDLHGNLQTMDKGADIVVSNADIKMTGNRSISTNNGNILLDQLMPIENETQDLVLFAGEGNITIDQALGSSEMAFKTIDIMGANNIQLMGAEATVNAGSLKIVNIGDVRLDGQIKLSSDFNLDVKTLQINADVQTSGDIHITANDETKIFADIQSSGSIIFSGPGQIDLDGDMDAENDINIDQAMLSLHDNHEMRSQTGDISLFGISTEQAGYHTLKLFAGSDMTFNGPVGEPDQVLGGLDITHAENVTFSNSEDKLYANHLQIQSVTHNTNIYREFYISGDLDLTSKNLTILNPIETEGNIQIHTTGEATLSALLKGAGKIDWHQEDELKIDQNISAQESITFSGAGKICLGADISIIGIGAELSIDTATLELKGDHQLSTIHGDILLNTIETNTPDKNVLTVSAGNGNVEILNNVGLDNKRMGGLEITDANKVAFSGKNASMHLNTLSIHNQDILTIQSDIQSIGELTFIGAGDILLGADLETTGANSNISILYSTVKLMSDCDLISHHGDIQLANIVSQTDDHATLKLDANNNDIFFKGATGKAGQALAGLEIVQADHVHMNGETYVSGDIKVNSRLLSINNTIESVDQGNISFNITEKAEMNKSHIISDEFFLFQHGSQLMMNESTIETKAPTAYIDIQSPLMLNGNSHIDSNGGNITLSGITSESTISDSEDAVLSLSSKQGNITFNGPVGEENQYLSKIQINSANNITFASSSNPIYTDQLQIQSTTGHTLIDAPLYVNPDMNSDLQDKVILTSSTLTVNAPIHFKSNADLEIITTGETKINADLNVPGNILFDGTGDIHLSADLYTTDVQNASIKIPDAALIVSGNRILQTQSGDIELRHLKGDTITLSPGGGDVYVYGTVGESGASISNLKIIDAGDVSFISNESKIFATSLDISGSGKAVFEGDVTVIQDIHLDVGELNISSHLSVFQDVSFDINEDITIMGLHTNNNGNISLISQTGQIQLGTINAGQTGTIELKAQKGIDGGRLVADRISVASATIGTITPPILDTQNFSATLTGSGNAFVGHIKMASPEASLPDNSQINYLGDGLMVFLVEDMSIYGLDGKDRVLYPLPVLEYEQHKLIKDSYLANRPEFFMIPPLNVDISIENDAEIEFLQMD